MTMREHEMGQLLIRNLSDDTIEAYKAKAQLAGTSLEQYLRNLIEANKPYTREERGRMVRRNLARFKEPVRSLTLDEIREGLEGLE
jgi:plasmid stability protein